MNNILTFSEYRNKVKLYEELLVKEQILNPINESVFSKLRKKINEKASVFVREALAEEIEMGKKLNEQIQESVKELKKYIDKIQEAVDDSNPEKTELMKKLEKIFEDIRKSSFELLEILSGLEINFADYVANASMATFVNFGMLFIPIRSTFLLKKSYKYFIGLIKNTIRKDLLMLMLNFDQFENTVLIQSLEDNENLRKYDDIKSKMSLVDEIQRRLLTDEGGKRRTMSDKEMKKLTTVTNDIKKGIELQMKVNDRISGSIGFDTRYDNTYTKTLDQLKNFVLEDDSKYLESIKNGMRTLSLDEIDTKTYVELLISAAEECAYEVSAAIHTNFIDKVSVFKLANQKQLIEIVKKDKEYADKLKREGEEKRRKELDEENMKKEKEIVEKYGPKIFKKIVEDHDTGKEQVEEYKNLETIDADGEKRKEKDILLSWFMLDDGKNWKDNKDKVTKLLKLHLYELHNSFYEDDDLNKESFLKYVPIITSLEYLVKYEISGTKSKPIKKPDGFSLKKRERLTDVQIRKFLSLVSEYNKEKEKYEYNEERYNLTKEVLNLINENLLKGSDKIDVDEFMEVIEGICCKKDSDGKITIEKDGEYDLNEENTNRIISHIKTIKKKFKEVEDGSSDSKDDKDDKKE